MQTIDQSRLRLTRSHIRASWMRPVRLVFVLTLSLPMLLSGQGEAATGSLDDLVRGAPSWVPTTGIVPADPGLDQLLQDYGPVLGSRFAGAWLDGDGIAQVAVTEGPVPSPLADHPMIQIVERRFSMERLDATIETVIVRLGFLTSGRDAGGRVPYAGGVNVWDNVVDVEIDPQQEPRREEIEEALASELNQGTVRIIGYDRPLYQARNAQALDIIRISDLKGTSGSRRSVSPYRGGVENYLDIDSLRSRCTLGFVMRNSVGVRFHSTAGHCPDGGGPPYPPRQHDGRDIGRRSQIYTLEDGHGLDFQTLWHDNPFESLPTNFVFRDSNPSTTISSKVTSASSSLHGRRICSEGMVTGTMCGALTRSNAIIFYMDRDENLRSRSGFGEIATGICEGDSGAPVISDDADAADLRRAYGMVVFAATPEGEPCGSPAYFEWVPRFEERSTREVLLTATTESLGPGQRLDPGRSLLSRDRSHRVIMQNDGNLVIYRTGGGGATWATGTNGPNRFAVMQGDGNFVVYGSGCPGPFNACWATGTSGSNLRLTMQDNGKLVVRTMGGSLQWTCTPNC